MRKRDECDQNWWPRRTVRVRERDVRKVRKWVKKRKKGKAEKKRVTQRADQAEGSKGDFSCRPDPSLTNAGATLVNWTEVVVLN